MASPRCETETVQKNSRGIDDNTPESGIQAASGQKQLGAQDFDKSGGRDLQEIGGSWPFPEREYVHLSNCHC
jgi:hypothetical protein